MFKIVNGHAPSYLIDLVCKRHPTRNLRSNSSDLLVVPRTFSKFGNRRFSVTGPLLWNALPLHIKNVDSAFHFKKLLKTYFFTVAFSA